MENLLIIGAGQSAIQCISTLKKEGYSGSITLVGEEEHLPYQRPPLSKGFLEDSVNKERLYFKKLEFFTENKVQLYLGLSAEKLEIANQKVYLSDNSELEFDKLVFATGSRVRYLDFPGCELKSIFYLRDLDDAEAIKKDLETSENLVIIGAGYIGLEAAAIAAKKNKKVTIIEMADRVMNRTVDPQISEYYLNLHKSYGVNFHFNTSLETINKVSDSLEVVCSDGTEMKTDSVLIGAGVVPNIELAEEAGIYCDNGIIVDEFGQTNFKNIYACGDCTNHPNKILNKNLRLESVHNAMEQAKTIAFSVMNNPMEYNQVPWFWSDQYDHKLQIVGLSGDHDAVTMRGNVNDAKFMLFYTKDEELIAVDAINNPKEFLISRKLVANKVKIKPNVISDLNTNLNDLI
ncbi:MAG: FAD-dependent oxidoreductase [Pseudomonadota bacterium]|nr:FAD-dependent oxidoreductase [Pseudomonadota bacterium]